MSGVEEHLTAINELAAKFLEQHRQLKDAALEDPELPDVARVVLGMTGSQKELEKYDEWAMRVSESIGQPVMKLLHSSEKHIGTIIGGLISGKVFAEIDQFYPGRQRRASLKIPVDPSVEWHLSPINELGRTEVGERSICLASFLEQRGSNRSIIDSPDWDLSDDTGLFIGAREILLAPRYAEGMHLALFAVEEAAKEKAAVAQQQTQT